MMGPVPQGMEVFSLDEPNRPEWVRAHYGKLPANSVSAVSLAVRKSVRGLTTMIQFYAFSLITHSLYSLLLTNALLRKSGR